jgi:hypothetical protein
VETPHDWSVESGERPEENGDSDCDLRCACTHVRMMESEDPFWHSALWHSLTPHTDTRHPYSPYNKFDYDFEFILNCAYSLFSQ